MSQSKHVLKFSIISNFFTEAGERRLLQRGENAVESNHIKSFQFTPEILLIKGEVYASMRDRTYNVEVNLLMDGDIKSVSCTCPRGQFLCHHVAAICIYAHYNISVTDVECRWATRKPKEDEVKTIDELYVSKTHVSTSRRLNDEEINNFHTTLQQFGTAVGFTWLLHPEPTFGAHLVEDVEDIVFSQEYFTAVDKEQYFYERMKVSSETVAEICQCTIGQAKNENWLRYKKNRITASNFGIVLAAVRKNKYPPSLYKRLTGFYSLENIKAVQWGIVHETTALKEFQCEMKKKVIPTGLWLHSCGFLGATPDGLVENDGIIEVKCPFKFREKIISHELKTDRSYIVYFDSDDEMQLNKTHEYYHQIQGNLAITGRKICYLFIWTPKENLLMVVGKDDEWDNNLTYLKHFYMKNYLPHIISTVFDDI